MLRSRKRSRPFSLHCVNNLKGSQQGAHDAKNEFEYTGKEVRVTAEPDETNLTFGENFIEGEPYH
jgi:hypothetical protein